jgi:hypothetical protein
MSEPVVLVLQRLTRINENTNPMQLDCENESTKSRRQPLFFPLLINTNRDLSLAEAALALPRFVRRMLCRTWLRV